MSTSKRPRDEVSQGHPLDLKLLCGANKDPVLVCSQLLRDSTRSPAIKDIIGTLTEQHPHASPDTPMELPVPEDNAAVWQVVWKLVEQPLSDKCLCWGNLERVIRLADKYNLLHILQACEVFVLWANTANKLSVETSGQVKPWPPSPPPAPAPPPVQQPHPQPNPWGPQPNPYAQPYGALGFGFGHPGVMSVPPMPSPEAAAATAANAAPFGYLRVGPDSFKLELSFLELLHRVGMRKAYDVMAPHYLNLVQSAYKQLKEGQVGEGSMVMSTLRLQATARVKAVFGALSTFASSSAGSEAAGHVMRFIHEEVAKASIE